MQQFVWWWHLLFKLSEPLVFNVEFRLLVILIGQAQVSMYVQVIVRPKKILYWCNMLKQFRVSHWGFLSFFFFFFFFKSLFEHVEILTRLAFKVLVSEKQYKLHNESLFGNSLLPFSENSQFQRAPFSMVQFYYRFLFFMQKIIKKKK